LSANWRKSDFDLDYTGRSDVESYSASSQYRRSVTDRQEAGISANISHSEAEGINCRFNLNNAANPGNPASPVFEPCTNFTDPLVVTALNDNETDGYNVSLDYKYELSETAAVAARFGIQDSDSSQTIQDADGVTILIDENGVPENEIETNFESTTYDISFTKKLEISTL